MGVECGFTERTMSSRMNWDRVRKESLARVHGSEWVNPYAKEAPPTRKKKANRRKKRVRLGPAMPGCTCGKSVGFQGQHKKRCPLCRIEIAAVATTTR